MSVGDDGQVSALVADVCGERGCCSGCQRVGERAFPAHEVEMQVVFFVTGGGINAAAEGSVFVAQTADILAVVAHIDGVAGGEGVGTRSGIDDVLAAVVHLHGDMHPIVFDDVVFLALAQREQQCQSYEDGVKFLHGRGFLVFFSAFDEGIARTGCHKDEPAAAQGRVKRRSKFLGDEIEAVIAAAGAKGAVAEDVAVAIRA